MSAHTLAVHNNAVKTTHQVIYNILNTNEKLKTPMPLPPWSFTDTYAVILSLMCLPFAIGGYFMFSFIAFPMFVIAKHYMNCCIKRPKDRMDLYSFYIMLLATLPLSAFLYFWAWMYWACVFFGSLFFSLPVLFVRVFLLCQGSKIINNFRLLWPYMTVNNQSLAQGAIAIMGQIDRQGPWEFTFGKKCGCGCPFIPQGFGTSLTFIPLLKYNWHANPFLFILEEVFCNQWTPPITNLKREDVVHNTRVFVSRFIHTKPDRDVIDHVKFAAHYPWPPHNFTKREHVVGIQFPEKSKMINFTNTMHVVDGKNSYEEWDKDHHRWISKKDVKCRSQTGAYGVYEVRLYWLMYHFLTGYVEVNYRVDKGLEHPMWCIMSPHSYLATLSFSWVNDLFAAFVPDVVSFVEVEEVEEMPA
jgi:hypothetical protein